MFNAITVEGHMVDDRTGQILRCTVPGCGLETGHRVGFYPLSGRAQIECRNTHRIPAPAGLTAEDTHRNLRAQLRATGRTS
jgi:hypothetical protein